MNWLKTLISGRPHLTINRSDGPYLQRWCLIPHNRFLNVYLHRFLGSDEDAALHNHPWWSIGMILKGKYLEYFQANYGSEIIVRLVTKFKPKIRSTRCFHRVKLFNTYKCSNCNIERNIEEEVYCWSCREGSMLYHTCNVWTIFITGPKIQDWGFLCPKGFIDHKDAIVTQTNHLHEGIKCPD